MSYDSNGTKRFPEDYDSEYPFAGWSQSSDNELAKRSSLAKANAAAKSRKIFERQLNQLTAYALKAVGENDYLEILTRLYLSLFKAALNGAELTPKIALEQMRNHCLDFKFSASLPNVLGDSAERIAVSVRETRVRKVEEAYEKTVSNLPPRQNMVYRIYVTYYDEIPKTCGKFETLARLVNQDRKRYGFSMLLKVADVKKVFMEAQKSVRKSMSCFKG